MYIEITITVIIAVLGLVVSYQAYQLNKDKESKSDVKQSTRIETQLEAIGKGVDDIRIDLKSNEKNISQLSERVTRVEESSKQAHLRINQIEGVRKHG